MAVSDVNLDQRCGTCAHWPASDEPEYPKGVRFCPVKQAVRTQYRGTMCDLYVAAPDPRDVLIERLAAALRAVDDVYPCSEDDRDTSAERLHKGSIWADVAIALAAYEAWKLDKKL